ncbi:MAG: hypothetical protein IT456_24830 [Planctomycetes bacterium]|nr:hypothetical protein [Planctomycetota bacterium]
MRWISSVLLSLAACGSDPMPATVAPDANHTPAQLTAPGASVVTVDLGPVAERLLQGNSSAADRSTAEQSPAALATAILAAASKAKPAEQGRAPAALGALGAAALPQIAAALVNKDPGQRRIAALTLLHLGPQLHADGTAKVVLSALDTARSDADLAVRAAAELAYQRATGDTSALDASRAAHEAAVGRDR